MSSRTMPSGPSPGIVYVVASQRSGATLLGRLLGQLDGVLYAGQLASLATYATQPDARCSCGARLDECDVWGRALTSFEEHAGLPLVDTRAGDTLRRFELLAACAAQASEARWVVDTSRSLTRARRLYARAPARVRIVHLTRHGRGVAFSRRRAEGVGIREASRAWAREFAVVSALSRTVPRAARASVRYETVCADPGRLVRGLSASLGLPAAVDASGREHIAFANPSRMRPVGPIERDDSWLQAWSAADEAAFHPAARLLCNVLGYDTPSR